MNFAEGGRKRRVVRKTGRKMTPSLPRIEIHSNKQPRKLTMGSRKMGAQAFAEVGAWQPGECSVECGGGEMTVTRYFGIDLWLIAPNALLINFLMIFWQNFRKLRSKFALSFWKFAAKFDQSLRFYAISEIPKEVDRRLPKLETF